MHKDHNYPYIGQHIGPHFQGIGEFELNQTATDKEVQGIVLLKLIDRQKMLIRTLLNKG